MQWQTYAYHGQAQPVEPQRSAVQVARRYGLICGLLGALVTLTQVVVATDAARANLGLVISLQISLVRFIRFLDTSPLPPFFQLIPVFVVTYLAQLAAFLIALYFAWQAGRLGAQASSFRELGRRAARRASLWSGLLWLVGSLLAIFVTHEDGSLIWVFATILASLNKRIVAYDISAAHPGPAYTALHLALAAILDLIAFLIGYAISLGVGALGAASVPGARRDRLAR